MADPTAPLAFFAGLVSFLSPCVLPLVPGYLSYMSGLGAAGDGKSRGARTTLVATTFVLGFTVVFVALGATATYLGSLLDANQDVLAAVGGIAIILMGLVFIGLVRVPWLYREARFHPSPRAGVWGSIVLGDHRPAKPVRSHLTPCVDNRTAEALRLPPNRASGSTQAA